MSNRDRRARATARQGMKSGDRFAQIPESILESEAYGALPDYAKVCLVAIASRYTGFNNGDLSLSEKDAGSRGVKPKWKLRAGIKILAAAGLISVTRQGRLSGGGKLCNLYALTWRDVAPSEKHDQPSILSRRASNDWANWKKPDDWDQFVKAAGRTSKGRRREPSQEEKIPVTPQFGTDQAPQCGADHTGLVPDRGGRTGELVVPTSVVTS